MDGRSSFLSAVCMGCLEGWTSSLHCRLIRHLFSSIPWLSFPLLFFPFFSSLLPSWFSFGHSFSNSRNQGFSYYFWLLLWLTDPNPQHWFKVVFCRHCLAPWDGSQLILGTMYSYDIFAAVPCCADRLKVTISCHWSLNICDSCRCLTWQRPTASLTLGRSDTDLCALSTAGLRIRIRNDPDYFGKLDPDPHYFGKLVRIRIRVKGRIRI